MYKSIIAAVGIGLLSMSNAYTFGLVAPTSSQSNNNETSSQTNRILFEDIDDMNTHLKNNSGSNIPIFISEDVIEREKLREFVKINPIEQIDGYGEINVDIYYRTRITPASTQGTTTGIKLF